MKYFYDWDEEDKSMIGPDYSSAEGSVIKGQRVQVAIVHKKRGSGSRLHHHPIYVLKGNLKARVEDQEKIVKPGGVIHIPANALHNTVATSDGDVTYYVAKDTSWGIAGIPADGKKTGPQYEPGFEPKD